MNLGIFLPIGSSFKDQRKSGQDKRFIDYYLKRYCGDFKKVYIFSYEMEKVRLPRNCILIPNKFRVHRFFYTLLLPFLHWKLIKEINIFRVMQLTGIMPAVLTKIFFKKPFIFTYGYDYATFARLQKQRLREKGLRALERIGFKYSQGAIITSKKLLSLTEERYPEAKLFYLPNGVDIKKFKPTSLKTSALVSKYQILTIARLEKQKNLDSLVKAVSLLRIKNKIFLLFIGQGKLKVELLNLAKRLDVNLKIIDRVPHDKIVEFYHKADIFCLPSYLEGQPKALLEAMACGIPCLVGRYKGVEEFKDRKEVLLSGFKTKAISLKLDFLLKDISLRRSLSVMARKRTVKDFDLNALLDKEVRLLLKAANYE